MLKGAPKSSRDDPQFMDNYYKSSRLHFIGTWKARIEALAAKSAGKLPTPASAPFKWSPSCQVRLWAGRPCLVRQGLPNLPTRVVKMKICL